MRLDYYRDTDTLSIELRSGTSAETDAVSENVTVDYDAAGEVLAIDVEHASRTVDLTLELNTVKETIARLAPQERAALLAWASAAFNPGDAPAAIVGEPTQRETSPSVCASISIMDTAVIEQLNAWRGQEVYVQISQVGMPAAFTYRGILKGPETDRNTLQAWTLVADEVLTPIRGVALNLHLFGEHRRDEGQPPMGPALRFIARDMNNVLTGTLAIYERDPFEAFPQSEPIRVTIQPPQQQ